MARFATFSRGSGPKTPTRSLLWLVPLLLIVVAPPLVAEDEKDSRD